MDDKNTVNRLGFDCTYLTNQPGDNTDQGVLIRLGDRGGDVVLPQPAFDTCVRDSGDPDTFLACILAAKEASGEEWRRERGPDSELGRNQEAGTPKTDHSSDPQ